MARTSNSLPAFLLALKQTIVTTNSITGAPVVPPNCVQISTEDDWPQYIQGPYVIQIIPGDMIAVDEGGEGQNETIFEGKLMYRLIGQSILDAPISDELALTDSATTTGLLVLFQQLLPIIRFWDGCDSQGNMYLVQPMRLQGGLTKPRRNESHEQYVFADLKAEFKICIATGKSGA